MISLGIPSVGSFMGARLAASPEITSRVVTAIATALGVAEATITPTTEFQGLLGGDSTKIVELVQAMESEFSAELNDEAIPDEVYRKWTTVQNGIDYLAGLGQ